MLLLNVPYEEKDEAKALGARWNADIKKWYVFSGKDYHKFDKWIARKKYNTIICDRIYVIVGMMKCFRCHKQTPVVGIGIDQFFSIEDERSGKRNYSFNNEDIHICPTFPELPVELLDYLSKNYGVRTDYSKTVQASYIANHCSNCSTIQGNFFIFDEVDSPFFITNSETVKDLTVLKYKLPYDIACTPSIRYSSTDDMIKKYADIKQLTL